MGAMPGGGGDKKKSSGGITGGLKKIGGAAVNALNMPGQVLLRTGATGAELLAGDVSGAMNSAGHGLGELLTLGQKGGDVDIAQAAGKWDSKTGTRSEVKLPTGVNTALTIALDPLNVTGAGVGAKGAKGVSTLAKTAGVADDAIKAGIKSGAIDLSKGSATRSQLVKDLIAGGTTPKQAEKIAKMTNRRGAGGVTAFVPFTEVSKTFTPGVSAKAANAVGDAVKGTKAYKKTADVVGEMFDTTHKLAKDVGDKGLATDLHRLADLRQSKAAAVKDDLLHELRNARELAGGQFSDVDKALMLRAMEEGTNAIGQLAQAEPRLAPALEVLQRARAADEAGQVKHGLLDAKHKSDTYVQRLLTDEAADVAKGSNRKAKQMLATDVAGSLDGALKQTANKARTIFPKMPAGVINELKQAVDQGISVRHLLNQPAFAKFVNSTDPQVLDVMAKDFEELAQALPKGSKLYQEDVIASVLNRSASANRAIQGAEFVDDIKALSDPVTGGPLVMDEAQIMAIRKAGGSLPNDWVTFDLPHLGQHAAPAGLAAEIKKVAGLAGEEGLLEDIGKLMMGWQKFWKSHATTGLLGALPFAMRNGRSNVYLMASDGNSLDEIGKAGVEMKKFEDKVRSILGSKRIGDKFVGEHAKEVTSLGLDATLQKHLTQYEYELWRAMQKEGIITKGFFDTDFTDSIIDQARKVSGQKREVKGGIVGKVVSPVLSTKGGVSRFGRDLNQSVETHARMTLFKLNMDRYGDVTEAARQTKKVLFDYDDLTEVEKKLFKSVVPFYTFMRKNLPRQLETLIESPVRISLPESIAQAISGELPEGSPDYQEQGGARVTNPLLGVFGGAISTPDRPFQAAVDVVKPLTLAATGEGKAAAREGANTLGGPQINLLQDLTAIGTGKDPFTGGNVQPGRVAALQRLVGNQLPSVGRLPRIEQGGVSAKPLTGKQAKPTIDELLKLLTGLRLERPRS